MIFFREDHLSEEEDVGRYKVFRVGEDNEHESETWSFFVRYNVKELDLSLIDKLDAFLRESTFKRWTVLPKKRTVIPKKMTDSEQDGKLVVTEITEEEISGKRSTRYRKLIMLFRIHFVCTINSF